MLSILLPRFSLLYLSYEGMTLAFPILVPTSDSLKKCLLELSKLCFLQYDEMIFQHTLAMLPHEMSQRQRCHPKYWHGDSPILVNFQAITAYLCIPPHLRLLFLLMNKVASVAE